MTFFLVTIRHDQECDIIESVVHLFPGRGAAFAYFLSYFSIIEFTLQIGISSAQDIVSSRLFLKMFCVRIVRTCGLSVLLVYCISNHGSFLSIAGLIIKQFPLQTLIFSSRLALIGLETSKGITVPV